MKPATQQQQAQTAQPASRWRHKSRPLRQTCLCRCSARWEIVLRKHTLTNIQRTGSGTQPLLTVPVPSQTTTPAPTPTVRTDSRVSRAQKGLGTCTATSTVSTTDSNVTCKHQRTTVVTTPTGTVRRHPPWCRKSYHLPQRCIQLGIVQG